MGKKSTPSAPAAPDPTATANAQMQSNIGAATAQANLNRVDQYTPQGSLTYQQIGTNTDGTPRYQQTQQYSAAEQQKYDQNNQIAIQLNKLAGDNISRVQDAQSKPFSYDGMTPIATGVQTGGLQYGVNSPQAATSTGYNAPVKTGYDTGGAVQTTFGGGGDITRNVSPSNVQQGLSFGQQFNPGDFNATAKAAADASYSQATSRLDPQFQQQQSDLGARLANSGIAVGSEAYNREMDNFSRSRNDAYNQAAYSSQAAGLAAQQQGYGQQLNTRQQQANETTTAGNFANAAAGQIFGMGQQNAALNNSAQAQQFGQNQAAAQFGNNAQAQQNAQNAQQAQFGNMAQDQGFQQAQQNAGLYNQGTAQNFQQGQQNAALNNTAQNQQFNQGAANAALQNSARQQQISEATYLRNLPLNEIAALLGTGTQVQNPNFQNVAQVGVAAPDYQGAVYQNYNAANQQYNQAQANRSAGLGSIFGLAGSLGAAAISDRRLKHNIRRVGQLANGLATYVFSYIGSTAREFGVMAQEAINTVPDAVVTLPSGYMAVDYRKVW